MSETEKQKAKRIAGTLKEIRATKRQRKVTAHQVFMDTLARIAKPRFIQSITPPNLEPAIGFVERKATSERMIRAFAMRQSRARLERNLTGPMIDAECEIEKAYRAVTEASYGNTDMARLAGMSDDDYEKWIIEQQTRLKQWTKDCPSVSKGIVLDYLVFAFPFTEISNHRAIDQKTVASRYRIGLNHWAIMRGWGSQFKER